ncbi:MAG: Zn-dependent exopeptidase M28 [Bacteroides sp.]|nr:Zn-dependent exopeptidase M28 [Bacteroides sp.]
MKGRVRSKTAIILMDQFFGSFRLIGKRGKEKTVGYDIFPSARQTLKELSKQKVNIVLIAYGHYSRRATKILQQFIPRSDQIVSIGAYSVRSLRAAFKRIPFDSKRSVFVAADRMARIEAIRKGVGTVPHLVMASAALAGEKYRLIRMVGSGNLPPLMPGVIPYYLEHTPGKGYTLLATATRSALGRAATIASEISEFSFDIAVDDLYAIRVRGDKEDHSQIFRKLEVLHYDTTTAIVVVRNREDVKIDAACQQYGRTRLLIPHMSLLQNRSPPSSPNRERIFLQRWPSKYRKEAWKKAPDFPETLFDVPLCPAAASALEETVARYSGAVPVDTNGPIASRHIWHPDNTRCIDTVMADLESIGYDPYIHSFTYLGATYDNVIADLPGTGRYMINPDLIKPIREIYRRYPLPDPPGPWRMEFEKAMGKGSYKALMGPNRSGMLPIEMRMKIEHYLGLYQWYPWWREIKLQPWKIFVPPKLVIVGGHLDCTSGYTPGYDPYTDASPGADDNASSLAATLALASYFKTNYQGSLRHTLRFCFFNAEEQGLVGSEAYAAFLSEAEAPVKAAICMDMIGYDSDTNDIFEVHSGSVNASVQNESDTLSDKVVSAAVDLGSSTPQAYKGLADPATGMSDHASFQANGFPAVVISEDYFCNPSPGPSSDPNPNYHRQTDTTVNGEYMADITCIVAHILLGLAEK